RRRHTSFSRDWSSDVCSSDLEAAAREVARILKRRNVSAVAVCFMNAFVNGANEKRMKEILQEAMPDIPVSTSSEVLPEIFEHEQIGRASCRAVVDTTV